MPNLEEIRVTVTQFDSGPADSAWQRQSFPPHWTREEIRYWQDLQERFLGMGLQGLGHDQES